MHRVGAVAPEDESLLAGESNDYSRISSGNDDSQSVSQSSDAFDLGASAAPDDSLGMWAPPKKRTGLNSSSDYAPSTISLSSSSSSFSK